MSNCLRAFHRVEYVRRLSQRELSPCRANPNDVRFDPLKAAILHMRRGEREEAFWLTFLSVHFGKHGTGGWRYLREVYGRLGAPHPWDWATISAAPAAFRAWLQEHQNEIRRNGVAGGFGNHRKYESLDGQSSVGTGAVVESYVNWVTAARGHEFLVRSALTVAKEDSRRAFDHLYRAMAATVLRFGRLASTFDIS